MNQGAQLYGNRTKYLIEAAEMPENSLSYPFLQIEQAYLSVDPVVRIRRQDDSFYLTYNPAGKWPEKSTISLKRPVLPPIC